MPHSRGCFAFVVLLSGCLALIITLSYGIASGPPQIQVHVLMLVSASAERLVGQWSGHARRRLPAAAMLPRTVHPSTSAACSRQPLVPHQRSKQTHRLCKPS